MGHNPSDWCLYKKRKSLEHTDSTEKPCTDTVRMWPQVSQGKISHKKPNLLALWAWMSSFQECKKINLPGLSYTVFCYDSPNKLIQPPSQTNFENLPLPVFSNFIEMESQMNEIYQLHWGFPVAGWSRICLTVLETCIPPLDWEDPLVKKLATHSSILA